MNDHLISSSSSSLSSFDEPRYPLREPAPLVFCIKLPKKKCRDKKCCCCNCCCCCCHSRCCCCNCCNCCCNRCCCNCCSSCCCNCCSCCCNCCCKKKKSCCAESDGKSVCFSNDYDDDDDGGNDDDDLRIGDFVGSRAQKSRSMSHV